MLRFVDYNHVELFAIGATAIAGARIHLRIIRFVVVSAGEFAIVHHRSIAFHQIFNPWGGGACFRFVGGPTVCHRYHIAFLVHFHQGFHLAGGGDAGVVGAQALSVGCFHNFLNSKGHRFAHLPTTAFGKCQVIVVGIVGAGGVVFHPIGFECAASAKVFIPQAEFVG